MSLKEEFIGKIDSCRYALHSRKNRDNIYDSERDDLKAQIDEFIELKKKIKETELNTDSPALFESLVREVIRKNCHDTGVIGHARWELYIICGGNPKCSSIERLRITRG